MGVSNEYGRLRKVLLCRPDYFKWVPTNEINKKALASGQTFTIEQVEKQYRELCDAFKSAGVEMLFVEPGKDLPYQMFTRDLGKHTKKGVLLGRYKLPIRHGETILAEQFFIGQDIPILAKIAKGALEGGDCHYIDNETMVLGVGGRSDRAGFEEAREVLAKELGINLMAIKLNEKFYHLDCVFVRVNERLCLAYTPVLPDFFLKTLKDRKIEIIEVTEEEVMELKCNGVAIDEQTFMSFRENERLNRKLEALGLEVLKPDLSIFTRAGGGPRCACFPLEREAA